MPAGLVRLGRLEVSSVVSRDQWEHRASRLSTDKKVLLGISAAFLMGVIYSLWMSMK